MLVSMTSSKLWPQYGHCTSSETSIVQCYGETGANESNRVKTKRCTEKESLATDEHVYELALEVAVQECDWEILQE